MHFSTLSGSIAILLAGAEIVSAHGAFVDAYGNADPTIRGYGLGYGHDTERKGTWLFPHQKDVPVFSNKIVHDKWWKHYNPNGCGTCVDAVAGWYQKNHPDMWDPKKTSEAKRWAFLHEVTPNGAYISVKEGLSYLAWQEWAKKERTNKVNNQQLKTGIPKVTAGGSLSVMNYQINLDGAGPFKCKIDYRAAADSWSRNLVVTKNCPGDDKSLFWPGIQKECWFTINMPQDLNCQGESGTVKDLCIVRCENNAENGPFGGCIPVQQIRPVKKPVATKKVVVITSAKSPKETVVVTKIQTVTVEKETYGYGYNPAPEKEDAKKPAPRPKPADKKPTKEEIKAAMGGEKYDTGVAEELENENISGDEKAALHEASKNKDPMNNYAYY
ncbi:hypothetical protein TWF281_000588 [Arthrobotrys megalospora]